MAMEQRNLSLVHNQASVPSLQLSPEKIDLITRTVAKGASRDELEMFLYLAGRYNLDPFLKEIWFIKRQKKNEYGQYENDPNAPALIMTSRDGYLKIAQSDPDFDGLKAFVVREGDHFEIDAQSDQIVHKFGAKRGGILGAWAVCHHKKRKPSICFVDFNEYNANNNVWQKYPSAMIQKVAEVFVLKRQFNINGLVTQEELAIPDYEPRQPVDVTPNYNHQQLSQQRDTEPRQLSDTNSNSNHNQNSSSHFASERQQKAIYAIAKSKGLNEQELDAILVQQTGKRSTKELTSAQASDMIKLLQTAPQDELQLLAATQLDMEKEVIDIQDSDLPF